MGVLTIMIRNVGKEQAQAIINSLNTTDVQANYSEGIQKIVGEQNGQ